MDTFLQLWGGTCYLLAKVFLARAEIRTKSNWRKYGWIIYLIGVPAWIIILAKNKNWIAMTIEAGGMPSMILGLIKNKTNCKEKIAKIFVFVLAIFGIIYSICDYGGITALSQILELGVTVGFLIGTYLLAKKNPTGWIWFVLMNVSMGTLMFMQEKWIFSFLQIISLYFVISGFRRSKNHKLIFRLEKE